MRILSIIINSVCLLILADAVFSWIMPATDELPRSITSQITEPLYAPIHFILDPQVTGNIDLAPFVILFVLQSIDRALRKKYRKRNYIY